MSKLDCYHQSYGNCQDCYLLGANDNQPCWGDVIYNYLEDEYGDYSMYTCDGHYYMPITGEYFEKEAKNEPRL